MNPLSLSTCAKSPRLARSFAILSILLLLASVTQAATIVDLTAVGNSGTINAAIYEQVDPQSTGTGVINSFVQQKPQGNGTTSAAYNTTVNNVLNNNSADNFNRSIVLADVSIVLRDNTLYREFILDVNESAGGGSEFISLDEVQLFVGGTANSSVTSFTGGILDHDGTLVYRMDAGMDNWVALDYALGAGSGSGDMVLLVPQSAFAGFSKSDVVTLYSEFGLQGVDPSGFTGDFGGSAGFEEWAVRESVVIIPEPGTIALLAVGLLVCAWRRR